MIWDSSTLPTLVPGLPWYFQTSPCPLQYLLTLLSLCPKIPVLQVLSLAPSTLTEYPLKHEYKEYTPEKILKLDSLACIQSAVRYNQQGLWIFSTPKLFREKFKYLPAYNLRMELSVTPKPMPTFSSNLPTDHTGKLFRIVYITLTGVIDTIILAAGLWSWVGKPISYLFKLASFLWWALSAKNQAQVTPENNGPAAQDWIPDKLENKIRSITNVKFSKTKQHI
ncbi:hypothetical protein DSO57_1001920 [Entomophthora muscae]|uniref:Uncharacterized protein n=1 Tax=Entomophthora muscae TaxID=34485 RepID=A0ACC2UIT1_9FUNG|nr:hypothetical protein DSO57_1001920 [Entomophthora muscae]